MKIRIKQILLFFICLVVILIITSPFILTWAVNTPSIKTKIAGLVKQKAGIELVPSNYSLTLLPRPGIEVRHLELKPVESVKVIIESVNLNVDLQALLSGKIVLGNIVMTKPEIKTVTGKTKPLKKEGDLEAPVSLEAVFELIAGGIQLIPEDSDTLEIVVKKSRSDYFGSADGTIKILREEKKIIIDTVFADIEFFPAAHLGRDFSKYVNVKSIRIAQADLKAVLDASPSVRLLKGSCRIVHPELAAEDGTRLPGTDRIDINFNISPAMQQVSFPPAALTYPEGILGIDFLNHPAEGNARLAFSGVNVNVGQARESTLNLFKNLFVPETLFSVLLDGTVPVVEVSLESKGLDSLINEHNLKLSGKIVDGKVHIPETRLIASKITGDVTVKDGVLNVISPQGMIKTTKIRSGNLMVDLLNYKDVPFNGKFDLDLDLSMLPETLVSLLPGTIIAEELAMVSQVRGRCNADLDLELKTGSDEPIVHVSTDKFSARGKYKRIPGEIAIDSVGVTYEPDLISLKSFNGLINGNRIKDLECSVSFKGNPFLDIKKGSAAADLAELIPWLTTYEGSRRIISPVTSGSGTAAISSVQLSGPVLEPEKWKYKVAGKLINVSVGVFEKKNQIEKLSCNFDSSEKVNHAEEIYARVNGRTLLTKLSESEYSGSIRTPFSIENARFRTGTDPSFFNAGIKFDSGPVLHVDLTGRDVSSLSLNAVRLMDKDITDASVSFHHEKNKPLFEFNGRLNTRSLDRMIKPGSPLDKKIKGITGGRPIRVFRDKTNTINIITPELNADSFLGNRSKDSSLKTTTLTQDPINFKADRLKIKKLVFRDVDTKISFKENHSYIRIKDAGLCDLKIQGYINIKDGKVYASIPVASESRKDIQPLLSCLLEKEKFMDGPYSLSCNLLSEGVPTRDVTRKIKGDLNLDAKDGRIYKLTLLSRILSVLNVSKVFKGKIPNITQEGFAYTHIEVKADIKDSVIQLKHAVIDGQDMTMIFTGQIDPVNDKINLTCLVAPFKTVDLIIEKIPIINTLLGGRLVSVPVKATGKLSDPAVIPLHPSAVGKGLVDMMSRIVKSPITLLEKMVGEDDE